MAIEKCMGIRFKHAGRVYFFKKDNYDLKIGDGVIVETIRGIEYGQVVKTFIEVEENNLRSPLKSIIRVATDDDYQKFMQNKDKEQDAFEKCQAKIKEHGLPMKLLDCEYTFDCQKVIFYFSAENRVDFRELVKDLAQVFKLRIELRQIGVRDETKILGGFGCCGRPFCCSTFLSDFKPVSIKMVKEQGISLNPTKISGACGRLMCCLANEEEVYEALNKNMPTIGDKVRTKDGLQGTVISINALKQIVRLAVELQDGNKEVRDYNPQDLKFKKRAQILSDEVLDKDLKALEELEKTDKSNY